MRLSLCCQLLLAVSAVLFTASQGRTCTKRVLVGMSSASELPITLPNGTVYNVSIGFYFDELMIPLMGFLSSGWQPTFGNPGGKRPPMDARSNASFYFDPLNASRAQQLFEDAWTTLDGLQGINAPVPYANMTSEWLDAQDFDALFIPGGHAPMVDLFNNADLGSVILHFLDAGKPVAAICHGPVALLSAGLVRKPWPFTGRSLTVFSTAEEKMNELRWGGKLPFYPQAALASAGGNMQERPVLYMPNSVRDYSQPSVLVTGQNPYSAPDLSALLNDELLALCGTQ